VFPIKISKIQLDIRKYVTKFGENNFGSDVAIHFWKVREIKVKSV
jgi:hypothetical protein